MRLVVVGFLAVSVGCGDNADPAPADADPGPGNPYPVLQAVAPATIPAGAPATTITITGANFMAEATIVVDGFARAAAIAAPESLTFDLSADELVLPTVLEIAVVNPGPGGGVSRAAVVRVIEPNRAPTVVSIAPDNIEVGSASFDLTVTGADFLDGAVVRWNGAERPTTFMSETELVAAIPDTDVAAAATAMVDVVNPGPGGGPSASGRPFYVFAVSGDVGVAERVSLSAAGSELEDFSDFSAVSDNGRYVAWKSGDSEIVAGDDNNEHDAFVRDTCRGAPSGCVPTTIRASINADGSEMTGGEVEQVIASPDGRYVAFRSDADPMVPGSVADSAYIRDTCLGAPSGCVPVTVAGSEVRAGGFDISDDGRYMAFLSSERLVPEDQTDTGDDVYIRDTCLGQTACTPSHVLVSIDGTGMATGQSNSVSASATGRFIAFRSIAALDAGDTNGVFDVHVRDTCLGAAPGCVPQTVRASVDTAGAGGTAPSWRPSIDPSGRFVAFMSSSVLAPGALADDIYLRDTCLGATGCTPSTVLVSVMPAGGGAGNGRDVGPQAISDGGRYVLFASQTDGIDPRDDNGVVDIYVRDTCTGATGCTPTTVLISIMPTGDSGNDASSAAGAWLSRDGRFASFSSRASNLIASDTNGVDDVFLATTGF